MEQSGADGIMIGRGLLRNPWLLRQICEDLSGKQVFEPTLRERCDFVCRYIDQIQELPISPAGAMGKVKCFLGYFTRGLAWSSQMRERAYRFTEMQAIRDAIVEYFDLLEKNHQSEIFDQVVHDEDQSRFRDGDARRCD